MKTSPDTIVTGFLGQYSDGEQIRTVLVTTHPYHDPALESALDIGTARSVIPADAGFSCEEEIFFYPQGRESSLAVSDLPLLNTGRDFDKWSGYTIAGLPWTGKRGYAGQAFADWQTLGEFEGRDRVEFTGRDRIIIPLRDRFAWLRRPVAQEVFDDDTPNTALINTTVPLAFGEVAQARVPLFNPAQKAWLPCANLARVNAVAEGGNPNVLFERHGNIVQQLADNVLQITMSFGGPPLAEGTLVDLLADVGSFDNWTAGHPDGFSNDKTDGVTITEEDLGTEGTGLGVEVTGGGDVATDWKTPGDSKFIAGGGGGWSFNGAADHVAAVQADDSAFVRGAPGGTPIRTAPLKFFDFDWGAIPNDAVIDNIELRAVVQDEPDDNDTSFWGGPVRAISMRLADDTFLAEKLRNVNLPATKETITLSNWGIELTPEQLNDAGFGFSFALSRNEGESARGRVFQVEARVKYTTGALDYYDLWRDLAMVPGVRYRIRISSALADESIRVEFGGVENDGDPVPEPQDEFSEKFLDMEGLTAAEATFIAQGPWLALRFRKAGTVTGKQIISQVEIWSDGSVRNTLVPLTEYVAELEGLDPEEEITLGSLQAVQNFAGAPILGWYVRNEITNIELLRHLVACHGAEIWGGMAGKISAATLLPPEHYASMSAVVEFGPGTSPAAGISEPDKGKNLTDLVWAGRVVDPLTDDRTAKITTTWTEADRQMVVTDWRITERARFDDLVGFTPISGWSFDSIEPTSGAEAGGTAYTITGNFRTGEAVTVMFGETEDETATVDNSTTITGTTPAGTGTVDVTVTQGEDSDTLVGGYIYQPAQPATQLDFVLQGGYTPPDHDAMNFEV